MRSDNHHALCESLKAEGISYTLSEDQQLEVVEVEPGVIARLGRNADALTYELTPLASTLEEAYMALTRNSTEYRSDGLAGEGESKPMTKAPRHTRIVPAGALVNFLRLLRAECIKLASLRSFVVLLLSGSAS